LRGQKYDFLADFGSPKQVILVGGIVFWRARRGIWAGFWKNGIIFAIPIKRDERFFV